MGGDAPPAWHTLSTEAACERLRSEPIGLTNADARARRGEFGPTILPVLEAGKWAARRGWLGAHD